MPQFLNSSLVDHLKGFFVTRREWYNGGYVGLNEYVAIISGATLTGTHFTGTAVDLSSIVPENARAVNLRLFCEDTVAGGWVAIGPGNTADENRYHLAARTHVTNLQDDNNGIITLATPQTIYRTHDANGGTITWYLFVLGYYI